MAALWVARKVQLSVYHLVARMGIQMVDWWADWRVAWSVEWKAVYWVSSLEHLKAGWLGDQLVV